MRTLTKELRVTTIAFDGTILAADTLATDAWGLKLYVSKILIGKSFVAGVAGSHAKLAKWFNSAKDKDDILDYGYPDYQKEENDPGIILVIKDDVGAIAYQHVEGIFIPCSRPYHAVGSGRDYALGAMCCGKDAIEAVEVAMQFDNNTGGTIRKWSSE